MPSDSRNFVTRPKGNKLRGDATCSDRFSQGDAPPGLGNVKTKGGVFFYTSSCFMKLKSIHSLKINTMPSMNHPNCEKNHPIFDYEKQTDVLFIRQSVALKLSSISNMLALINKQMDGIEIDDPFMFDHDLLEAICIINRLKSTLAKYTDL